MKYTTKAREFVVAATTPEQRTNVSDVFAKLEARLTPLKGDEDRWVVKLDQTPGTPAEAWRELQRLVGANAEVLPVLADDDGRELFPTGRLHVRFKSEPTDRNLKSFAKRHGLKLLERNEFQPEQAAFVQDRKAPRFLMNVVDSLDHDDQVRMAWPETKSRYEKKQ